MASIPSLKSCGGGGGTSISSSSCHRLQPSEQSREDGPDGSRALRSDTGMKSNSHQEEAPWASLAQLISGLQPSLWSDQPQPTKFYSCDPKFPTITQTSRTNFFAKDRDDLHNPSSPALTRRKKTRKPWKKPRSITEKTKQKPSLFQNRLNKQKSTTEGQTETSTSEKRQLHLKVLVPFLLHRAATRKLPKP